MMQDYIKSMQKVDTNLPGLAQHTEKLLHQIAGKNLPFAIVIMPDVGGQPVRYVSNVTQESSKEILVHLLRDWGYAVSKRQNFVGGFDPAKGNS